VNALEAILKDAFQERGHLVNVDKTALLEGARARRARARRRTAILTSALAVVAVIGTAGLVATWPAGSDHRNGSAGGPGRSVPAVSGAAFTAEPPHDWVWQSSLGLVIAVPGGWDINDYGCGMTNRPSVVRGRVAGRDCYTPEPANKNLAIIGATPDRTYDGMPARQVTIDGVAATRIEGMLPDGRYAGALAIPSRRVFLDVRTTRDAERQELLNSARLVDVDHLGCPTARPPLVAAADAPDTLIPAAPTAIQVCLYGGEAGRLRASTDLSADDITRLVNAIGSASPGRNPDAPPDQCTDTDPTPDSVLRVTAHNGTVTLVWATFSGCVGRGLDNGAIQAHISEAILEAFMGPLRTGYSFHGSLGGPRTSK
jgi:hypothetical protein